MQLAPHPSQVADRSQPSSKAPALARLLIVAALVVPHSGCAIFTSLRNYVSYNDTQNDFVMGFRNSVWAQQAWHERRGQFAGQPYLGAFGDGFRAGYVAVASGGNGCPPAVPPRKYWTWKYQSPEGQAKVAAWFTGFPFGAQAAEEEQAGEYQNIQVSYAIEHQYSPEFNNSNFVDPPGGNIEELDPLPNPAFIPAPEIPLDDSAAHAPGPFPVPTAGQFMPAPAGVLPSQIVPVTFEHPVDPIPPTSSPFMR